MTPEEQARLDTLLSSPMFPNETFIGYYERVAAHDKTGLVLRWLEDEVYSNLDLMYELDPGAVKIAQGLVNAEHDAKSNNVGRPSAELTAKMVSMATDNRTAHLAVGRIDLATGLHTLSKFITLRGKSQANLSYDGTCLTIALDNMSTTIRATGSWDGEAHVDRRVIRGLARELPNDDPIEFTIIGNELRIGSTTVPCVWCPHKIPQNRKSLIERQESQPGTHSGRSAKMD